RRIGGGVRWIELRGGKYSVFVARDQVSNVGRVRQVAGHKRREFVILHGRLDPLAIVHRHDRSCHRRNEIGHNDCSTELHRGEWRNGIQHRAVTKMDMPVIRSADGKSRHSWMPTETKPYINWRPQMKSSIVISSSGLCEPLRLRTNIMPEGIPTFANTAAS